MEYFAETSDYISWHFVESSDYVSWDTLQKHLFILCGILWRNICLYFRTYIAETSDYISWNTLQKYVCVCGIFWRNILLYFMTYFTEISDYTLWHILKKHLIILHEIFVQKLLITTYESLWTSESCLWNYELDINLTRYSLHFVYYRNNCANIISCYLAFGNRMNQFASCYSSSDISVTQAGDVTKKHNTRVT